MLFKFFFFIFKGRFTILDLKSKNEIYQYVPGAFGPVHLKWF